MPATDLSHTHGLLNSLFPAIHELDNLSRFELTNEQVTNFQRDGFVAGIQILDDEQVDQLCEELAELMQPDNRCRHLFHEYHSNESVDPNTVLFHALGAWRASAGFHDLLWHPAFTVPASQLLDGPVRFWHDQLFCKPAQHGGVVAWHQDYSYWTRTVPMQHLTCWIALDDADEANGAIHYVPGSHRWPLMPITGLAGDMTAIESVLSSEMKADFRPVCVPLKRGHASFHHPLMVHGSKENCSNRSRRATVVNVFRDGVKSESNEPLLQEVPVIPQGQTVTGQFFPLLFDPMSQSGA